MENAHVAQWLRGFQVALPKSDVAPAFLDALEYLARFPRDNPGPVMCIATDGRLLAANPASEHLLADWRAGVGELVPAWLLQHIERLSERERTCELELSCGERWYQIQVVLERANEFVHLYGQETTARKLAEIRVRDQQRRLRAILDTAPECIKLVDRDGRLLEINAMGLALLEADSLEQVLGGIVYEWVHEHDREALRALHDATFRGAPGQLAMRAIGLKGTFRWLETRTAPLRDDEGGIVAVLAVTRDITDARRTDQALRESEQRYRSYVDHAPHGVFVADERGRYVDVNPAACAITGYTAEELLTLGISDLLPREFLDAGLAHFEETCRTGASYCELPYQGKADHRGWWSVAGAKLTETRFLGITTDVTARRTAEENLRRERDFTKRLLDAAPVIVLLLDPQGNIRHVNRFFERLSGYRSEEIVGRDWFSTFLPERDHDLIREVFHEATTGTPTRGFRNTILTRTGEERQIEWYDERLYDSEGRFDGLLAIGQDVTDRARAEAAAQRNELRFRKLIENSAELITLNDPSGVILYVSPPITAMLGYAQDDFLGRSIVEFCHADDAVVLHAAFERLAAEPAATVRVEARCQTRSGEYRWLEIVATNQSDEPTIGAFVFNYRDITERKQADADLRIKDAAIAASLNAIVFADLDTRITYVNSAFLRLWGYERAEEIVGRLGTEFFADPAAHDALQQLMRVGTWVGEVPAERRDGTRFDALVSATMVRTADGEPSHLMASIIDVTEQRRSERELRELWERYDLVIKGSNEGVWDTNLITNEVFVSKRLEEMGGLSGAVLVDGIASWLTFVHPEDRPMVEACTRAHLERREPYEVLYRQRAANGEYRWFHTRGQAMWDESGRPTRFAGTAADVTDQVRAQEALRASESRLAEAQQLARLGSWEYHPNTNHLIWSWTTFEIFELDPTKDTPSYERFTERVHRDDRDNVDRAYWGSIANRSPYEVTHRLEMDDGRIKYVHERCETIYDEHGAPLRSIGTVQDVTDRVMAEEEIRRREENYRRLFHQMPDGVFVMDPETTMPLEFNRSMAENLGYDEAEFAGLPIAYHAPEDAQLMIAELVADMLANGRGRVLEGRAYTKTGELRHFAMNVAVIERDGRKLLQCIARDITDDKRAKDQLDTLRHELAHVTRLGMMGEMASGLAHELNQPLGAISTYAHLAANLDERQPADKLREYLARIGEQAIRAGEIIRRLRSFVKGRDTKREDCDLNHLVEEVFQLAAHEVRHAAVRIHLRLVPDIPRVFADSIQIQQVLLNLVRNALDAMSSPRITTRVLTVTTLASATTVSVRVSDTGEGISPELAATLFEPFHTSKREGLGMGLAISRAIIEAHHGKIFVGESSPQGTTIGFDLPCDGR